MQVNLYLTGHADSGKIEFIYGELNLNVNDIVTVNLMFKHYCMETNDDKLLQGYYVKINSYEEDKENNN